MNKKFLFNIQERAKIPIHTFYEANLEKKRSTAPMVKPCLYNAKKIRLKGQKTKISIKTLAASLWNSQIVSEIASTILLNLRMVLFCAQISVYFRRAGTFQTSNMEYGKNLSWSENYEPYQSLSKIAREIDLRGSQVSKLLPCTWKTPFSCLIQTFWYFLWWDGTVHSEKGVKRSSVRPQSVTLNECVTQEVKSRAALHIFIIAFLIC